MSGYIPYKQTRKPLVAVPTPPRVGSLDRAMEEFVPRERKGKPRSRFDEVNEEIADRDAQRRLIKSRNRDPYRVLQVSYEEWLPAFAARPLDVYYEYLAQGHDVSEIALAEGFPVSYFTRWCEDYLDRKTVMKMRAASAAILASESLEALNEPTRDVATVQRLKAKSEAAMRLAERKDAETWGPPKPAPAAQPPVSLIISLDGNNVPQDFIDEQAAKRKAKLLAAPARYDPHETEVGRRPRNRDGTLIENDSAPDDERDSTRDTYDGGE